MKYYTVGNVFGNMVNLCLFTILGLLRVPGQQPLVCMIA